MSPTLNLPVSTLTTGTVPTGHLANPVGNPMILIGGSSLPVATYTLYVTAINYFGSDTKTLTLVVAIPPFSNTKSWNPLTSSAAYFRDDVSGQENNNPFYRAGGPTGNAWTVFGWAKNTKTTGWQANNPRPLINFGGDITSRAGLRIYFNRHNAYYHYIYLRYGDNTNYVDGGNIFLMATGTWFSWAVVYDGTATTTTTPFTIYVNGVALSTSPGFAVTGTGWTTALESDGTNDSKLHIAKIFDVSYSNMSMAFIDDIGIFDSDQSANISNFHAGGTPIDLNFAYSPFSYYRFGDVPTDISAYPLLTDEGSTGNDLTAYTGTVADYQSDTPP